MSFSSPGFIFAFMPIVFSLYYLLPERFRNLFLFAASLGFYFVDAGAVSYVLVASVFLNHLIAFQIIRAERSTARNFLLWIGVILNLAPLLYYKYWNFLSEGFVSIYQTLGGVGKYEPIEIALPIGISFFTFQGISYIVDVYRREVVPTRTVIDFGMYHTLFPQLVAGPIVRYKEVESRIQVRPISIEDVQWGIVLFCIGLGKKIIIADNVGVVADKMFGLPLEHLSFGGAWLGITAYTLQIFFDFSGYSDMAIGMGRMLGFRFPDNFDQPYRSQSITEFWRRWHMTLSRWFRDYLYIPLGGNRAGPLRTYLNLGLVFLLCGLWHGAALTFLVWGLWHGLLLIIERVVYNASGWRPSGLAGWAVTLLLVMIGWVFFRSATLDAAWGYLSAMAGYGRQSTDPFAFVVVTPDKVAFLVLGGVLALLPDQFARFRTEQVVRLDVQVCTSLAALAMFVYSASLIATNGFNPFIYFRF